MQITVTHTVDIKFRIKNICYGVTASGEVWNINRCKKLKRTVIGTTIGYCIAGKFKSLAALRNYLELIPKEEYCPF